MNNYPLYKCHKVVPAFKILRIAKGASEVPGEPDFYNLWPTDHDLDPVEVSQAWHAKHQPQEGGYVVFYKDGYTSFSPAKAFEDGYTLEVKAPDSKFDKVMRRVMLALIYVVISAGVVLMGLTLADKLKGPGSWSFVDKSTGATCIVLDDGGRIVMNCLPAVKTIPETTKTTITVESEGLFMPESRT